MSSKKTINFLIVGQGIAGTTLAHKLYENGNSVHIIDNKHQSSSSLVAGGVVHPMSFKRVILSWKADSLIPAAKVSSLDILDWSKYLCHGATSN